MTLATGRRLGPYQVLVPLGAGGMGEVYRARDTRLDHDVALKVLPERVAGHPQGAGAVRARGEGRRRPVGVPGAPAPAPSPRP